MIKYNTNHLAQSIFKELIPYNSRNQEKVPQKVIGIYWKMNVRRPGASFSQKSQKNH